MGKTIWRSSQDILLNFISKMYIMENNKQLPPKFSYATKDMAQYFDVFEKTDRLSNLSMTSSNMSFKSIVLHDAKDNINTSKNQADLMPIQESMLKRNMSRSNYRNSSVLKANSFSKKRVKRQGSSSLPHVNSKSSSRSRSSSKGKKYKYQGFGRQSTIRKIKARVLKNAVRVYFIIFV
jgi:hypothetical protein